MILNAMNRPIILCVLAIGTLAHGEPANRDEPLPTLDELLGLDTPGNDDQETIVDANDAQLDRALSAQQAGEAFSQAVTLMEQVAERLGEQSDLSITTQRLQDDILTMLDQVIQSAQSSDSKSGSSSSSEPKPSEQSQPDQQQAKEPGEGDKPSGESQDASMPGGSRDAKPGDEIAPDGVGWGSLPERIREALSQGFNDQYSELYHSITEQYYRSLAEDQD